jgi:NADPH-dependent 2,4-dienoyl-CoA reductase/sulfur reductase-like enzyme/peroxiredoxin family protein/rhodanese-related sulfurtransferase/TusA-related sulfurtransferase
MNRKRILIVGGVAGGASAAARARRLSEEAEIVLLERGPHVSFANCGLPYHIGGKIPERQRLLVTTPEQLRARFRIDVRTRHEVVALDRAKQEVEVLNLETGVRSRERYDGLVLSPGAEPVRPPIPGIDSPRVFTLRNLGDMDRILSALQGKCRAAVIGGGYIGLEMAEALCERKLETSLIELAPQVMGPADSEMAAPLHRELRLHGVRLRLGVSVVRFRDTAEGLELTLSTGETIGTDVAILAIGVRPETALARAAGLKIGPLGGIEVDDRMRTSDERIYAVGDAVEVVDFVARRPALLPLAGPANRQGRIAADNLFGRDSRYRATQGTAICKVFNLAIGMTGLSEKAAKRAGIAFEKVYIHPTSHASYYPGATPLSLKMLFDPATGKVLGAQAVGADGVDKRIDVLAVAIRAGLTVYDLESLELSYAPPFGSAKDPVNMAGFVAANVLRGDLKLFTVEQALAPTDSQVLLDVRTPAEVAAGTIPGAKNLPLDELRDRLGELSQEKEYLVFCRVGLRGYLACRILTQNGFACRNLSGGYLTFQAATEAPGGESPDAAGPDRDADEERAKPEGPVKPVRTVDAGGLQCPGPILQLQRAVAEIREGEAVEILSTDPGFATDVPAWCRTTGNRLDRVEPASGGGIRAVVIRGGGATPVSTGPGRSMTNVVFGNDFDKAMAAFIIANGAAAAGYEVSLFFTFWGINILRKTGPVTVRKNLVEKMFGWMMPRGPDRLSLSKMNMGGMGLAMIKGIMKRKGVLSLPELIEQARQNGVRFIVCTMSMDLMGIKREELIDGLEEGGVALYMERLSRSGAGLFIS